MKAAAATQAFEQAAVERNRLAAVRSLLERQRVANSQVGTLDAIAVALSGTDANAQVFQVRDGVLSDRQSFYLANEGERPHEEVIEEFLLQYYDTAASVPAQIVVGARRFGGRARGARGQTRGTGRGAGRGARREAAHSRARGAQRGARA